MSETAFSALKAYQEKLTENGMAHLIFYANELNDIIHPFSYDEYESLSDGFVEFLDKYQSIIPGKMPIVLEITGTEWTNEEKTKIDKAIWVHFGIAMTIVKTRVKRELLKALIYLVFTVLSAVLLFSVNEIENELIVNVAYVPFWFFGYRFLTILMIDLVPEYKRGIWYERLASIILLFSKERIPDFGSLDYEKMKSEYEGYEEETWQAVRDNQLLNEYLMNDGTVSIGCKVQSIQDFVPAPELDDRVFLSDEMISYLDMISEVVKPDSKVELIVDGPDFSPEEQETIKTGIRNYYAWCMADEERSRKDNRQLIAFFIGAIIVSCGMILGLGGNSDVAWHEFVLMLFWFFADYCLEFVLISAHDINKLRKKWEAFYEMDVKFNV